MAYHTYTSTRTIPSKSAQKTEKGSTNTDMSIAERLVRGFAEQLEGMKKSLKEGEVVMLAMGEAGLPRPIHKIDLKVSGPDVIMATVTWFEGDVEQRVYAASAFQPILTKESNSSIPEETRSMIEQILGHLTAHGILYTQMIASNAQRSGDAMQYLTQERNRALEVVKGAGISAADMNGDEIRNKAAAVVNQTFDSIQVDSGEEASPTRTLN
ncbi:MAG: hypothetical protein ACPGVN_09075 [Alphaproteobacteria bacterium]